MNGYELPVTIPEQIRVVTPGQVHDLAGLGRMQKLIPSENSDLRFLLPLPPNTDPLSPELFDFFNTELRTGYEQADS